MPIVRHKLNSHKKVVEIVPPPVTVEATQARHARLMKLSGQLAASYSAAVMKGDSTRTRTIRNTLVDCLEKLESARRELMTTPPPALKLIGS